MLKPCQKIICNLSMTLGKHLKLPNVSAWDTKPAPTAAAQGGFLLSLVRTQPNHSKVRHREGTQLGCGRFGAAGSHHSQLGGRAKSEFSYIESWHRFGLAWQEGLPGTGVLQSTCCTTEARQSLTLPQSHFSKEPVFNGSGTTTLSKESGQVQLGHTGQVREQRLARGRITTSLASHFP